MAARKLRFMPTKATFKLGDQLGAGTVGIVYRATSPQIDQPVAVKILHPNVSGDEKMVDRFEREIMITERMNHPHIVRHYGGGLMDGQYFYAMQLLERGTLKDRLKKHGPLKWPQAAAYVVQIASALQHAHNHGIVHRDLKPSNLFFAANGDLVLGDFGIARDTHEADISAHGMTVGTYSYMAPEQITADQRLDSKADLYSLGCVLFEMLTGKLPFQGANFAQVWEQHLHKEPPHVRDTVPDCPEWLDNLVQQLLEKAPADRPFSARSVEGLVLEKLIDTFGEEASRQLTQGEVEDFASSAPPEQPARWWVVVVALISIAILLAISAANNQ